MAGSEPKNQNGSKHASASVSAGDKHQTDKDRPDAKRVKKEKQTTLDDMPGMKQEKSDEATKAEDVEDESDISEEDGEDEDKTIQKDESAIQPGKEPDVPSNILEKGIIYFFIRARVNIDKPSDVDEVARTYFLLRPISRDAKLGEGPIGDAGNTRLVALPKKQLPLSGKDRFMAFVEKSGISYGTIKSEFLAGADYETKTVGTRHTPAATPVGEGVYAITTTGRDSHLVYIVTLPEKLGQVQKDLGLKERGSFILSTKNPQHEGPANARLPKDPEYPKSILDDFRSLRWMPSKPEHLNYANAQILLIGESSGIEKATEPQKKDEEEGKEEPMEVLEHLAEEDLDRMRHLPGDQSASVYADLQAHAEDYPKLQTTF